MKKTASRHILFIAFLIFGIVLAMQIKSSLNARRTTASEARTPEPLKEQLVKEQRETEDLKAAIDHNLAIKNEFINDYITGEKDVQLSQEWEKIKLITGLVDVKGPGIMLKMDDAPARDPDIPADLLKLQIIHDNDIKVILNELKTAGAQAIAINGERIVPMSEQVCAGPTIMINDNRYPVPYIIEAIGNPEALYECIEGNIRVAVMRESNIRVETKKSKEIRIPKFRGYATLDRYISGLEEIGK